jgi:hypothetical protein
MAHARAPADRYAVRLALLLLVAACGIAAYANSFRGMFVFDDVHEVLENPAVHTLWPPWRPMFGGRNVAARPLPYLSFAIDHSVWGDDPTGYHLTNLALHLLAAAFLFDLVARTLAGPRVSGRLGGWSLPIATATAAIWVVHPLTTQAVTYIYQRMEVMAAVAMLACLCAAERALSANASATGARAGAVRRRWQAASIAAAVAAMLSKETAVVLPLLVATHAWVFAASPAQVFAPRWRFWLAVAATWGVLAAALLVERGSYGELREIQHAPLAYLATQASVILHYVRLACWPTGQTFDYGWPLVNGLAEAAASIAVVGAAVVGAAWGVWQRRLWGWPAAAFFLLLAPTSSVLPVADVANEHRMYLPLACLIGLAVTAMAAALARVGTIYPAAGKALRACAVLAATSAVLSLGMATHLRNRLYHDRWLLWTDTLAKRPDNPRANSIVALMLANRGRVDESLVLARRAVVGNRWDMAFHDISDLLSAKGDRRGWERACSAGLEALAEAGAAASKPAMDLQAGLAAALVEQGKVDEADDLVRGHLPAMQAALGDDHPITLSLKLAGVRVHLLRGECDAGSRESLVVFEAAQRSLGGDHAVTLSAEITRGIALAECGQDAAAERHLRHVLAVQAARPGDGASLRSTATLLMDFLASRGRHAEARAVDAAMRARFVPSGASAADARSPPSESSGAQ